MDDPVDSTPQDVATLQFCANKLDKKDFFGKSDPFMVFYRSNEDGTFTICHKTEVVRNTLNPVWAAFAIPVCALCNGDHDRAIKVEVYDWDRNGSHDFIGEFTTSYRELARGQSHFNVYEVVNPRKKMKKKKYLNSGTVTLLSFTVEAEHTFLDYIRGGTQLNFTVAIDFTASNAMVELDGDDIRISSRGKVAERDIVQFVPFRDYMTGGPGAGLSMAGLAREVLAEIPDQLLSYMKARGIKPAPHPSHVP